MFVENFFVITRLFKRKKRVKIYFRVLSADTIGCHSRLSRRGLYTISAAMWIAYCHLLHLKPQLSSRFFKIKVLSNIHSIETTRGTVTMSHCLPAPAQRYWRKCIISMKNSEFNCIQRCQTLAHCSVLLIALCSKKCTTCYNKTVCYVRKITTQLGTCTVCPSDNKNKLWDLLLSLYKGLGQILAQASGATDTVKTKRQKTNVTI